MAIARTTKHNISDQNMILKGLKTTSLPTSKLKE